MRVTALMTGPLATCVLLAGCGHSWGWELADLDRNRPNLALYRGARDAGRAAEWVEYGTVVESSGAGLIGASDLELTVRYEREETDWFGWPTGSMEYVCYRFTSDDGYDVELRETGCPR